MRGEDNDAFSLVIYDWLVLGLYAGLRKQEWAHPTAPTHYKAPTGEPMAFQLHDFEFFDSESGLIQLAQLSPSAIELL